MSEVEILPDGTRIETLDNGGIIRRSPTGKMLPGTKPPNLITSENARSMNQKYREKTARLLREKISLATFGPDHAIAPSAAVAEVGAMIWSEVAANPKAHARDRLEAWQAIGKHAQMLGDPREKDASGGITIDIGADLARDLVQRLLDARKDGG